MLLHLIPAGCEFAEFHARLIGGRIVRVWPGRGAPKGVVAAAALAQALLINVKRVDVVVAHFAWPAGLVGAAIAEASRRPLVIHEHLCPVERNRELPGAMWAMRTASRLTAPSTSAARRLSALHENLLNVKVLPNAVKSWLTPDEYFDANWVPPGGHQRPCVVHFSGDDPYRKGTSWVELLAALMPDLDFHIIGRRSIEDFMPDNIIQHPRCDHAGALRWMQTADLVLAPSRDETFGLVAHEAAGLGRRCLASDVGAHRESGAILLSDHTSSNVRLLRDALKAPLPAPFFRPECTPEAYRKAALSIYETLQ